MFLKNNPHSNFDQILLMIPLKSIYRNLKKITPDASRAIGQYIQRQPSLSARSLASKLEDIGLNVSHSTISSQPQIPKCSSSLHTNAHIDSQTKTYRMGSKAQEL
ncbi:hypothetical protein Glove_267g15 [Diversispora epigaea]|uniref:Transposase Tc1-like domain-containing protein n=1 Tax=Diversispora epigaea TaxID=1348612 RepID=A0A397I531_9GLOM|nr:hypothetical protein Glove_267g15 [Diversispora epigaea]